MGRREYVLFVLTVTHTCTYNNTCLPLVIQASKRKPLFFLCANFIEKSVSPNDDCCLCVAGDFNSIRASGERVGQGSSVHSNDITAFDGFIRESSLLDMPLTGRKFTRYQPDGTCKSRIDRFLVNNLWVTTWPSSSLKDMPRTVSDHCPLALETKEINWGPKPFRFINAWCSHPEFLKFVETT